MTLSTIAVKLKIPDNTAYSALTALRRLGVAVERVERADVWQFEGACSSENSAVNVERNQTLFNPNKHVLEVLTAANPRDGETWIEELSPPKSAAKGKHYVAWRLFTGNGEPADRAIVQDAVEKLLCNPAIERAIM